MRRTRSVNPTAILMSAGLLAATLGAAKNPCAAKAVNPCAPSPRAAKNPCAAKKKW